VIVDFIDAHRDEHGVEPILATPENTAARIAPSTCYANQIH
jgi:putative transposase